MLEGGGSEARARVGRQCRGQGGSGPTWTRERLGEPLRKHYMNYRAQGPWRGGEGGVPAGCPGGPGVSAQLRRTLWSVWDSADVGTGGD